MVWAVRRTAATPARSPKRVARHDSVVKVPGAGDKKPGGRALRSDRPGDSGVLPLSHPSLSLATHVARLSTR
jgi:hypothetical protein